MLIALKKKTVYNFVLLRFLRITASMRVQRKKKGYAKYICWRFVIKTKCEFT